MQSDDGLFSNEELEVLMIFFLDQASLILESASKSLLALEENPSSAGAFSLLQRALHTLKGDSNSVGFAEIGSLAHRLEDVLDLMEDADPKSKREIIELLIYGVDALAGIVQRKGQWLHTPLDIKPALDRIDQFFKARDADEKRALNPDSSLFELNEPQLFEIRNAVRAGKKALRIEVRFDEDCSMKSAGTLVLIRSLERIGEVIAVFPSAEDDEALERAEGVCAVLVTDKPDAAQTAAAVAGVTKEVRISPMEVDVNELQRESDASAANGDENSIGKFSNIAAKELLDAIGQSDREEESDLEAEGSVPAFLGERRRMRYEKTSRELLRVDAAKVDKLMELVGELIISRSILTQICAGLKNEFSKNELVTRLADADSLIGRILGELQKSVLQVRMISLDQIFNRFFRIVRELSRESGKRLQLDIEGEDTELDKRIVDAVYEPLLHLVRNAADHGIESSEERVKIGKPPIGRILLRARCQGDQVVIEIEDDGCGIDSEKLKASAIEKGLRSLEQLNGIGGDALELMFLSGVSTAKSVTELSGRGVGMFAVKSAIDDLKGSIEVWSELGIGTRFTLRLPLTLAIVRAMIFGIEDRVFAVPVSAAFEIIRIARDDMQQMGRHKVYCLRENFCSLLELDQIMLGRPSAEDLESPFVIMIGLGDKRVGLVVDKVLGEREVVMKTIDREWLTSDLVAGASVLGDGRVLLMLDVGALLRRAVSAA